jgi:hypothetical protein
MFIKFRGLKPNGLGFSGGAAIDPESSRAKASFQSGSLSMAL